MLTLGIETTCDETAVAIVRGTKEILSNKIASQATVHSSFGGVIPELASRMHTEQIIPLLDEALKEANSKLEDIDLISVAYGPGLLGALMVGLQCAKTLAMTLNKPLMGINHIEAHLYAVLMSHEEEITFPSIGVVLSGGHTTLLYMRSFGDFQLIGQTVDDALGEAFDKVAKMMQLPYPGGPEIEKRAALGDPTVYPIKAGQIKNRPFDFSFSGTKTSVLYNLFGPKGSISKVTLTEKEINDMAASFQAAVIRDVIKKATLAAKEFNCQNLLFGGGVTNNQALRDAFEKTDLNLYWPKRELTLDNGAMIAGLAAWRHKNGFKPDGLRLKPVTRIPFTS